MFITASSFLPDQKNCTLTHKDTVFNQGWRVPCLVPCSADNLGDTSRTASATVKNRKEPEIRHEPNCKNRNEPERSNLTQNGQHLENTFKIELFFQSEVFKRLRRFSRQPHAKISSVFDSLTFEPDRNGRFF